jgi:hypothetical protein
MDINLRGRCHEMSKLLSDEDSNYELVRGYYHDPLWGKEQHWWCKTKDGTIVDPTAGQFPSNGSGVYEEFDGMVSCDECGKRVPEEDAIPMGNRYMCCSNECCKALVGL